MAERDDGPYSRAAQLEDLVRVCRSLNETVPAGQTKAVTLAEVAGDHSVSVVRLRSADGLVLRLSFRRVSRKPQ